METTLLQKLFDAIGDPVVGIVVLASLATVWMVWRLFGKQHEFIRERIDLLRQENDDLRRQMDEFKKENQEFKNENTRLKELSSHLSKLLDELRAQPLLREEIASDLSKLSQAADRLLREELPEARKQLAASIWDIVKHLDSLRELNAHSSHELISGFDRLETAMLTGGNRQAAQLLQGLAEVITETQHQQADRLAELARKANALAE